MATPSTSTPSVLSVLKNEELLTLICREFLPWDPSTLPKEEAAAGRVQLRDIALVCKAFEDPALSCLWTHLTSLIPLIKLLPNARIVDGEYVSIHRLQRRVSA